MKKENKKIIAAILGTGAIASGAFVASDRADCDYTFEHEGKELCVSQEVKDLIDANRKANKGFGGARFGG